jgi:hypothetical protein
MRRRSLLLVLPLMAMVVIAITARPANAATATLSYSLVNNTLNETARVTIQESTSYMYETDFYCNLLGGYGLPSHRSSVVVWGPVTDYAVQDPDNFILMQSGRYELYALVHGYMTSTFPWTPWDISTDHRFIDY